MTKAYELYSKGFEYHKSGNLEEAEKLYKEALEFDSKELNTLFMMANLKFQQYRYPEAEKYILSAISLTKNVRFYDLLTRIYIESKQYQQAIDSAIEGLQIEPANFELNFNIALALKNNKDYELSLKFYQRAEKLRPDLYLIPFNMSSVYFFLGEPIKSREALEKALSLEPNNDELKYFLSLAWFRERNYKKGFPLFESRQAKKTATMFQKKQYPQAFLTAKEWNGEDISNKTVYLYYEAGFGDVIQYARYFPLLKERCGKLLFKPQQELLPLFEENSLGVDRFITFEDENIEFDIYVSMLSLPYILGLNEDNMFVSKDGYIKSNPKKKEIFKDKYFNTTKKKIGIKWQGNTASETDRVIDIEAFLPLFDIQDVQIYSFQTGGGSEKLAQLAEKYSIIDISSELKDFSDTAAALDNLDYVICNDTSLLHLAGALRIPSYMLLPFDYNWRWHSDLGHCDWYSSVKMYRKKDVPDWNYPIEEVIKDLKNNLK